MYCETCREERWGRGTCVACGAPMRQRTPEQLREELSHVEFLLAQVGRWTPPEVPTPARDYLRAKYTRAERVIRHVLVESEAPPPPPIVVTRIEALVTEDVTAPLPPVAAAPEPPAPLPEVPERLAVPPAAVVEAPPKRSSAERPVRTARRPNAPSRWATVWRPFLYESIGWFLGAFLILAGSFYFVAESWAGMATLTRSLVVFGLTAAYSAGFALWGAYLGRRNGLGGAGRILSLIGSAMAPLAAIPLSMGGPEHPLIPALALVGWAVASAIWVGSVGRGVRGSLFCTTLLMGAAPVLGHAGPAIFWANVLPVLFFWRTIRSTPKGAERPSIAFAILAPAYLAALFAVRLHLALVQVGAMPALGTYAPFAAAMLGIALEVRAKYSERDADALDVTAVALQLGCLLASIGGDAPAFFATCAVAAVTTWRLARGAPSRVRWLYGTYAAGYFAYQSVGQLVPTALKELLARLRHALGYPPSAHLPVNFDAVYAVPFAVGVAAFALLLCKRPTPAGLRGRREAIAELLLRCTAAASGLFGLLAVSGADQRAALWSVPPLVALCLTVGVTRRNAWLVHVGSGLTLLFPVFATALWGQAPGAALAGGTALGMAFLAARREGAERSVASVVVGVLGLAAAALGWTAPHSVISAAAVAAAGAGWIVLARAWDRHALRAAAAFLFGSAVPLAVLGRLPGLAPLSASLVAFALAALSLRGGRWRAVMAAAIPAVAVAIGWQATLVGEGMPLLLGPVLLVGAGTSWLAARTRPGFGWPAAILLVASFAPSAWPWMTPALSTVIAAALCLVASVWTGARRASHFTLALGASAAFGAVVAALAGGAPPGLLLVAALGALAATRALHPSVTVPSFTLLAVGGLWPHGPEALLLLAAGVSLLGLLEERPSLWGVIGGGRPVAVAATVVAPIPILAAVLLAALQASLSDAGAAWLPAAVALALLPLLWARVTRWPWMAAAAAPLLAIWLLVTRHEGALWAVPLVPLLYARLADHLPRFRKLLLLGAGKERLLQNAALLALVPCGFVLATPSVAARPEGFVAFAAAFLFSRASAFPARLLAAALVCACCPSLRVPGMALLLAVGWLTDSASARLHRVLGGRPHRSIRPLAALTAIGMSAIPWFLGPHPWEIGLTAAVLFAAALLLRQRWLLTAVVCVAAAIPMGAGRGEVLSLGSVAVQGWVMVAAAGAAFAAALRSRDSRWASPLWLGSALCLGASLLAPAIGWSPALHSWELLAVAALLLITPDRVESAVAVALVGCGSALWAPPGWIPVGVSAAGLVLCSLGRVVERRREVGATLHWAGAAISALSLPLMSSGLAHASTPLTCALVAATAATVALRNRRLEAIAWTAGLLAAHVALAHGGLVLATGKPQAALLPYVGLASTVASLAAFAFAGERIRRPLGHAFAGLAMFEILSGIVRLGLSPTEGAVAAVAGCALALAGVWRAFRKQDELAAWSALASLGLAYLALRLQWFGASLGPADALVALGCGAVMGSARAWLLDGESGDALRRPVQLASFGLPLLGLAVAPWGRPIEAAGLLIGHAALFAALALPRPQRRVASALAVAAFNGSLVMLWTTRFGDAPYYVIPAALSALALIRVFRRDLSPESSAVLRACAVTAIYVASAWRALSFQAAWPMLVCVTVCLIGVAAGVALRIRSYVLLGSAILVACVLANVVHYGLIDHRLGAIFLSLLGLLVVGGMVLFTSHRSEWTRRYQEIRLQFSHWQA